MSHNYAFLSNCDKIENEEDYNQFNSRPEKVKRNTSVYCYKKAAIIQRSTLMTKSRKASVDPFSFRTRILFILTKERKEILTSSHLRNAQLREWYFFHWKWEQQLLPRWFFGGNWLSGKKKIHASHIEKIYLNIDRFQRVPCTCMWV